MPSEPEINLSEYVFAGCWKKHIPNVGIIDFSNNIIDLDIGESLTSVTIWRYRTKRYNDIPALDKNGYPILMKMGNLFGSIVFE